VEFNRRDFLSLAAGSTAAMAASGCFHGPKESSRSGKRKPNLLFIWTDEQRADTMAVCGNTKIHQWQKTVEDKVNV
jgi:hypothetical protein